MDMEPLPQDMIDIADNVDDLVAGMKERYKDDPRQAATVLANALGRYIGENFPSLEMQQTFGLLASCHEAILHQVHYAFQKRIVDMLTKMAKDK